jgi:CheY-like chemotaxis protein
VVGGARRGLTVLVVEDEPPAMSDLVDLLGLDSRVGRIHRAVDAVEALRLLMSGSGLLAIDAVFTGLRMPGLDGTELATVLQASKQPPALVFVTGNEDRSLDAFKVGALDYVLKPIQPDRLRQSVDRIMRYRRIVDVEWPLPDEDRGPVFLCHSSGDKDRVRDLYQRLTLDGVECWFDEVDLLPGQDWDLEITAAIRRSRLVLACLSQESITKAGYLQRELKKALDVADEQPEGSTFLIPVLLELCRVPQRLQRWQWADLRAEGGYDRLLASIRGRR